MQQPRSPAATAPPAWLKWAISIGLAIIIGIVLMVASGGGPSSERPGNPAVYDRIASETDCATLQGEFDVADARHSLLEAGSTAAVIATSYMDAAYDQMRAVGCS